MDYVWLCLAALIAGGVNAIAGGGTLLTFPALLSVVSEITANGTSTVALSPGSLASVWGYRRELPGLGRWIAWLTVPSLVGGGIGTLLVTGMDEKVFRAAIPWLILSAATLFLFQPVLARYFRTIAPHDSPSTATMVAIVFVQFLIGIYGGYFGAGIGILMLSSLSFLGLTSIHQTNALKSYLAFCMNGVAAILFIAQGKVHWPFGLAMMVAGVAGGYLGAKLSLQLKPIWVRITIILIGFGLGGYYLYQQWKPQVINPHASQCTSDSSIRDT